MNFYKTMEKGAIVAAHFGTTHEDTKEKTIDIINEKLKNEFRTEERSEGKECLRLCRSRWSREK